MFNDCQGETCTILIGHAGGMESEEILRGWDAVLAHFFKEGVD